ncbi:GNAT family N-acetyltransferase [Streptomyces fractus]|uniref:GNAT family N-acetyltransferase n=1 Tax=Streptomyces fractus TaxID=641806 RepID=UPI003CED9A1D
MIVGYAFEALGPHRVQPPRPEGVLRDALLWDGEWVDAVVMSILAPDWFRSPAVFGPRAT